MKVLLVSANRLKNPYAVYPLGLDYVVRALENHHQVQVMDLNAEAGTEVLADVLQDTSPDIVGISIRNIDNTDTLDPRGFTGQYRDLAALIRSHTTAPIVLGGSGFTIFPAELMALMASPSPRPLNLKFSTFFNRNESDSLTLNKIVFFIPVSTRKLNSLPLTDASMTIMLFTSWNGTTTFSFEP